jgi:hypothetical protein
VQVRCVLNAGGSTLELQGDHVVAITQVRRAPDHPHDLAACLLCVCAWLLWCVSCVCVCVCVCFFAFSHAILAQWFRRLGF